MAIYKSGQGYWTRVLSAAALAVVVLAGIDWLVRVIGVGWHLYVKIGVAVGVLAVAALIAHRIFNRPRIADFMIATEAEMKKVNWPSRREIIGSTWVVICGTLIMAALMFVIDLFLSWLFVKIRILDVVGPATGAAT